MVRMISQFTWHQDVAQRIKNAAKKAVLQVGIPKDATYPNGTKVETVAFVQEFGDGKVPPRPFFRNTIDDKKGEWAESVERKFGKVIKKNATGSAKTALKSLGDEIVDDVKGGIEKLVDPHLKPSTVAAKKKKGAHKPEKPLVDSGLLKESFNAEVTEG